MWKEDGVLAEGDDEQVIVWSSMYTHVLGHPVDVETREGGHLYNTDVTVGPHIPCVSACADVSVMEDGANTRVQTRIGTTRSVLHTNHVWRQPC